MNDYTYIEKRDVPLCDFCCREEAVYFYPSSADPIKQTVQHKDGIIHIEERDTRWGACQTCSAIVDQKNPMKLASHVMEAMAGLSPVPVQYLLVSLVSLYQSLLPNLQTKQLIPSGEGGGDMIAHGSEDFVKEIKKRRDELNEQRTEK